MSIATTILAVPVRAGALALSAAHAAANGLPAVRAALHGARVGAGEAFDASFLELIGVQIVPTSAREMGRALARSADTRALVMSRGGAVVRAGAEGLVVQGAEGVRVHLTPQGGAIAQASREAVNAFARTTLRGAVLGIGRASMRGAAAGAVIDGVIAGVYAWREFRRGNFDRETALRHVGIHTARGAVVGAAGVAAAGIVSAGIAATGITLVGAPVAIPIATMLAAGALAGRTFDRIARR